MENRRNTNGKELRQVSREEDARPYRVVPCRVVGRAGDGAKVWFWTGGKSARRDAQVDTMQEKVIP